ncbi:hypothetical protein [Rhodovibrio salinarum]|uniref:Uncharacterized protein n=1 Tax=Rhodovibrio salinarum TaxID=1087 RepID=A0A934QGY4_9PROT|nr:hypothetical protein [Rhodovibrio salinarum]MBK1696811.1 hypothetical protein [Rhodovibrio salinarum]
MPLHVIPWLIGAFMLTPFLIWLPMALFMFPGAWNGFDKVVGTSALIATVPLVAWFYIRGIASFANSMAGEHADGHVVHRLPRVILRTLPGATGVLALLAAAYLADTGAPFWTVTVPLAVGALVAAAIVGGERAASRLGAA